MAATNDGGFYSYAQDPYSSPTLAEIRRELNERCEAVLSYGPNHQEYSLLLYGRGQRDIFSLVNALLQNYEESDDDEIWSDDVKTQCPKSGRLVVPDNWAQAKSHTKKFVKLPFRPIDVHVGYPCC